jgi:DNA-binding transcriptional LysR family regulator
MGKTPIDYDLLAIFIAVADETSFSKAARKLGIGKGTVSRAIAELEGVVGAELLHRTTHQVALSTAGTALYERTAPHLAALDLAMEKLPERAEQPSGELRMTAPQDLGVLLLPELLTQFALRYPEISVDVRLTNRRVDLVGEGFDLAIRASADKLADSSLTARRLGASELRYYAAPSYVARRGEPQKVGDARHDWVMFRTQMPKNTGAKPRFISDDFLLVRELLQQGAGVGALPVFVADASVSNGSLVQVLAGQRSRSAGGFFLVYPSSGQVPRKVTAFRDFLLERLCARPIET